MIKKIIVLGLMLIIVFSFTACGELPVVDPYKGWIVALPENIFNEYYVRTEPGWGNDGTWYAVFTLETESIDFFEDFTSGRDRFYEEIINNDLVTYKLNVPENFFPDWNEEYCLKFKGYHLLSGSSESYHNCSQTIIMIYFPNSLKLIVYQVII